MKMNTEKALELLLFKVWESEFEVMKTETGTTYQGHPEGNFEDWLTKHEVYESTTGGDDES